MVKWKELNVVQHFNNFTFYSMFTYLIAPNFAKNNDQRHKRIEKRIRWNLILFCFAYFLFRFFPFNQTRNVFYFILSFFLSVLHHCSLFVALLGVFGIVEYKALISPFPCHALTLFISLQQILFLLFVAAYCHYIHSNLLLFHYYFHQWHSLMSVVRRFFLSIPRQRGTTVWNGNWKQKEDRKKSWNLWRINGSRNSHVIIFDIFWFFCFHIHSLFIVFY